MPGQKLQVVIVGAGFGGLNAAKVLGGWPDIHVLLIDRKNYHLFQPLLYQVATAGLSPADIAVSIRSETSRFKNIEVHLDSVVRVGLAEKKIYTRRTSFQYDYLILACGAQHSYFGHAEWEAEAPGLKTLEQATEIRRRILLAFEMAENEADPGTQKEFLTFVVIGGGPTGVELAGALAEISHTVLAQDFRRIDPRQTRILLIEAGDRVLSAFSAKLSSKARTDLQDLGVEVRTNCRVTAVDATGVSIGDERIHARTVIWAAGVQPSELNGSLGVELDRSGRVIVGADLSLSSDRNVFVIGDQTHFESLPGYPLPGLAPIAIQQGRSVSHNILRDLKGRPRKAYRHFDKGQMATIGKKRAVAQIKRLEFGGFFAWVAWLVIHIYYLIGFRNRVAVLAEWAWSYLFSKRSARLIVSKDWRSYPS